MGLRAGSHRRARHLAAQERRSEYRVLLHSWWTRAGRAEAAAERLGGARLTEYEACCRMGRDAYHRLAARPALPQANRRSRREAATSTNDDHHRGAADQLTSWRSPRPSIVASPGECCAPTTRINEAFVGATAPRWLRRRAFGAYTRGLSAGGDRSPNRPVLVLSQAGGPRIHDGLRAARLTEVPARERVTASPGAIRSAIPGARGCRDAATHIHGLDIAPGFWLVYVRRRGVNDGFSGTTLERFYGREVNDHPIDLPGRSWRRLPGWPRAAAALVGEPWLVRHVTRRDAAGGFVGSIPPRDRRHARHVIDTSSPPTEPPKPAKQKLRTTSSVVRGRLPAGPGKPAIRYVHGR